MAITTAIAVLLLVLAKTEMMVRRMQVAVFWVDPSDLRLVRTAREDSPKSPSTFLYLSFPVLPPVGASQRSEKAACGACGALKGGVGIPAHELRWEGRVTPDVS